MPLLDFFTGLYRQVTHTPHHETTPEYQLAQAWQQALEQRVNALERRDTDKEDRLRLLEQRAAIMRRAVADPDNPDVQRAATQVTAAMAAETLERRIAMELADQGRRVGAQVASAEARHALLGKEEVPPSGEGGHE